PYFPDFKSQFTKTPNLFFDEVLRNGKQAEAKVVGCLIRQTLGWNNEAGWTGLSRSKIAELMNMSLRSVTTGARDAAKKNWILIFDDPRQGKGHEPNYYFLNNLTNQLIVAGLERKKFFVEDLEDLTLTGIEKLLKKTGLMDQDGNPIFPGDKGVQNFHENTSSGKKFSPDSGKKFSPDSGKKFSPDDKAQSQAIQEAAETLKTSIFKDSSFKDISVVVVDILTAWEKAFSEELAPKKVILLLQDAKGDHQKVIQEIKNVSEDPEAISPIKCVRYGIKNGGWDPKPKRKPSSRKQRQPDKPAPNRSGKQNNDDLPRAVAQAIEREAKGEKVSGGEVDPIVEARLRAKLDRMRQRLSQRQKEITS
ncbi:hypothetical protein, partial [Kroppenstedtia guangzhouensis]|uniref:hypothetical protein n=1 Tax=Kroppenstedtia guangzhouensis TaxID=1274356 RepID=UPI0016674249